MICKFTGGLADGALAEIALEKFWIDEVPPPLLWVYSAPESRGPGLGFRASVQKRPSSSVYQLRAIHHDEEIHNVVYYYDHINTRQHEIIEEANTIMNWDVA